MEGAASNDLEGAASVASSVDEDGGSEVGETSEVAERVQEGEKKLLKQLEPSHILTDRFSQIVGQESVVKLIKSLIRVRNRAYEGCKRFKLRTSATILIYGHPGTGM